MATQNAQLQFDFGWDNFQKGSRGRVLWTNMKGFAKSRRFPPSYENPLHGLKQLANSGLLDSTNALRADPARDNSGQIAR